MDLTHTQLLNLGQEQLLGIEDAQATIVLDPAEQILGALCLEVLNFHAVSCFS